MQAVTENEFIELKWDHVIFSDEINDVTQYIPMSLVNSFLVKI